MDKKYIGIIAIIGSLLAIVGIIYYMFFYDPAVGILPNNESKEEEVRVNLPTGNERTVIEIEQSEVNEEKVRENDLKRIALSFSERFGSYSNQSNYGNIRDLKIFMSEDMKSWADNYIQEQIAKNIDRSIYYGVTTKSVAGEVNKFDEDVGIAEVFIQTQRREAIGTTSNTESFQQDIIINFVMERGAWKVDSAEWQEVK